MMFLLAFLGGVLTIASPCILPVIPLVFARASDGTRRNTLPLLAGLALAFTLTATIAALAINWLVIASEWGRYAALAIMAVAGLALISPRIAEFVSRPATRMGAALADSRSGDRLPVAANLVAGAAIGLLWAPCAGPILGLLIVGAAGMSVTLSSLLFLTFAIGAVMSLAFVLSAGARLRARIARAGRGESILRRGLGVATVVTVAAIFLGWDSAIFAKLGVVQTASAEEALVRRLTGKATARPDAGMSLDEFAAEDESALLPLADGVLQPFTGATEWINSPPITRESLRGKVVMIWFWTYECYNCLNALPHVKKLEAKYRDKGLVVISVHTPELPRERIVANVRREVKELGITYPVVVDNDFKIWNAYRNHYWPAAYYADATGKLRFHHFGEGRYEEQDKVVAKLLAEAAAYRGVR